MISIGLMAVAAEESFLWFYVAWFVTVVVITGLFGIFCALLANGFNRLEKRGSRQSQ